MALRHLDFPSGQVGLYGTTKSLLTSGVYAQYGDFNSFFLVDDPDPNITGTVARFDADAGATGILRYVLPATNTKVGIARRFWVDLLPVDAARLPFVMEWRNGANVVLGYVVCDTTGRLSIVVGNSTTTSTNPVLVANAWQHVEGMMNTATGDVEVRVEGVLAVSVAGLAIVGPIAQISVRVPSVNQPNLKQYLKDFAVWDGSGAFNNTFMGSIQVRELIPDGDAAFNWLASTGVTGFNLIDEAPPNDDTDYIYAVTPPPAASKFSVGNLPVDVTSVRGLSVVVRSRKTDGGDGNLQTGLVSGASTVLGTDRPITTAYTYWTDIFETDPATGAAWSPAAVNAVQLQLNRTL